MNVNYAERARALLGTRFRPQGRGGDSIDCVGVVVQTFDVDPGAIRQNYHLRGDHHAELEQGLLKHFRRVPTPQLRSGDVMLLQVAPDQLHLGVRTNCGFVHAHAGIGAVVEAPGMPDWPLLGVYRKRAQARCG